MHEQRADPQVGLVFVGFSPPDRLAALARHLRWPGLVLSDEDRKLYARLKIGRAPLWRVYSRRTVATYVRAKARGERLKRPVEDTRQLGGDAVVRDGVVVTLWRPRSPDDRPAAQAVLADAMAQLGR